MASWSTLSQRLTGSRHLFARTAVSQVTARRRQVVGRRGEFGESRATHSPVVERVHNPMRATGQSKAKPASRATGSARSATRHSHVSTFRSPVPKPRTSSRRAATRTGRHEVPIASPKVAVVQAQACTRKRPRSQFARKDKPPSPCAAQASSEMQKTSSNMVPRQRGAIPSQRSAKTATVAWVIREGGRRAMVWHQVSRLPLVKWRYTAATRGRAARQRPMPRANAKGSWMTEVGMRRSWKTRRPRTRGAQVPRRTRQSTVAQPRPKSTPRRSVRRSGVRRLARFRSTSVGSSLPQAHRPWPPPARSSHPGGGRCKGAPTSSSSSSSSASSLFSSPASPTACPPGAGSGSGAPSGPASRRGRGSR
mmetsp:Transcript_21806/g.63447  ORF Transcript_21806/g.63447 Transcript_21806/m.63447 type:complete len:365 (-) Transcript_21806:2461-3555(-)